jgi:hypothetical protein
MDEKVITAITLSNLPAGTGLSYTYDTLNEKGEPVSTNNKGFFYVRDEALKAKITDIFNAAKAHLSK